MQIYVHVESHEGDLSLNTTCAVQVELPALPRQGDTLFLSSVHQRFILMNILSNKACAENWCNLMRQWPGEEPFYSVQDFFNVKQVCFDTSNGGRVHVLVGPDEAPSYHEITDEVFAQLRTSFKNGKMYL